MCFFGVLIPQFVSFLAAVVESRNFGTDFDFPFLFFFFLPVEQNCVFTAA